MYDFKQTNQKEKGITLIVLVTTIVVLLILASITIGALTSENGIINNAKEAKEKTEIANEKEILDRATIQAMGNNSRGNLVEDELQEQLDKITDNGKTEVSDVGEEFEVAFKESKRYYTVDKDGNVGDAQEIIEDKSPGDITVGRDGEKLDGSEEHPYEIWCIEDLVTFSNMVNGEGIRLENEKAIEITRTNSFSGKYVILKANLNFKSKLSYADSERTDFGDINNNENDGNTLINEMTTGTGFNPIGISRQFEGIFEGNNKSIKNIFQNQESSLGLFANVKDATIKNIILTGNINSINCTVGGICGSADNTKIINCKNKTKVVEQGKISGNNPYIGGIVGYARNVEIINCSNEEDINGDAQTGGIAGSASGSIINCYNLGDITGGIGGNYGAVGGIVGVGSSHSLLIYNCFNTGEITSNATGVYTSAGGILGNSGQDGTVNTIINAYNIGKINEAYRGRGGIVGGLWYHNTANTATLKNTYYQEDGELFGYGEFESAQGIEKQNKEYMHSEKLVMNLNSYIENNADNIDTTQWKKWKLGENGYPIFE